MDPDVEQLLREAMERRRQSFKEALNEAVRAGLSTVGKTKAAKPFQVRPKAMGLKPGIDPARLNQLADELEAEEFVALAGKLASEGRSRPAKRG